MTTQANKREARYIPHPKNEHDFEIMCLDIYEEVYHSSRLFGRRGQWQQGLDILLNDYRAIPINKRGGRVFVQCKFTLTCPRLSKIKADVLAAAEKIKGADHYAGVYLFIVATNAENDSHLHDALQEFQHQAELPFEVEVHNWDKLCNFIRASEKLWSLYNHQPGEGVEPGARSSVEMLTNGLLKRIRAGDLKGAHRFEQEMRGLRRGSGYEPVSTSLANDIWKDSFQLRSALLNLYNQAADSRSALPLLLYEYSISRLSNVDSLLGYVRANRIVGNLRSSETQFVTVLDSPRFVTSLEDMAPQIFAMQGSTDKLACLALILIMESNDHDVQDGALNMVGKLRKRDAGAAWEVATHVAYAVVRYFYVRRRGWAPAARYYTLGDGLPGTLRGLDFSSSLLNSPFESYGPEPTKIAGRDPFSSVGSVLFGGTFSWLFGTQSRDSYFPELEAECRIYCCEDYSSTPATWKEETEQLGRRRAVDFPTLARIAAQGDQRRLLSEYDPIITERTFERLIGCRAYLRAYVHRSSDSAGANAWFDSIEQVLAACRYASGRNESAEGKISVLAVYDRPPPRLIDHVPESGSFRNRGPFTLTRERMEQRRERALVMARSAQWREELELRYTNRRDDFSLSCLLALDQHVSMLTFYGKDHVFAGQMGIAAQYPFIHG
ncbi:hypothetical protein [Achromobacter sp. GbtcB20]|uniref:hypothetical protein n=1 Tax=Achromobacter sp. GbtcB20 TaxID=2824765 RepID=UPI001266A820|nr:hypothetical protein [Achromobacter sp. GbtcB20]